MNVYASSPKCLQQPRTYVITTQITLRSSSTFRNIFRFHKCKALLCTFIIVKVINENSSLDWIERSCIFSQVNGLQYYTLLQSVLPVIFLLYVEFIENIVLITLMKMHFS